MAAIPPFPCPVDAAALQVMAVHLGRVGNRGSMARSCSRGATSTKKYFRMLAPGVTNHCSTCATCNTPEKNVRNALISDINPVWAHSASLQG